MQVGLVTPRYPPNVAGGGEISARMLAEQLQVDERVDSAVVLSFDGVTTERRNGVEVRRLADLSSPITEWNNVRAFPLLRRHIDDFDVVHAYNMELHPAVGAVGKGRSVGTVATLNSYHFLPGSVTNTRSSYLQRLYDVVGRPTTGRILEHYMKEIDVFVGLSTAVREVYADNGFDPARIEVVPNMIDPSFSVPETTASEGRTVLYVGELSRKKGVETLVRALELLPAEYDLRIVGTGPMEEDLQRIARRLDVARRITFTGRVDYERIPEQYALADIFVHPGVWPEPFGRTVLEAMQAELPVVCTDTGGPADLVDDPRLRCEPGDPEGLADAIERAIEGDSDVGKRNKQRALEEFSPRSVTSRIVDLYEQVDE